MRHLHWLFEELGLDYDKPNRTWLDGVLRDITGLDASATCYEVWAAIKALPTVEQALLPDRIRLYLPNTDRSQEMAFMLESGAMATPTPSRPSR